MIKIAIQLRHLIVILSQDIEKKVLLTEVIYRDAAVKKTDIVMTGRNKSYQLVLVICFTKIKIWIKKI